MRCDWGTCCASEWGDAWCTDLGSDWSNCGACGRQCGDEQECIAGDCACWGSLESCGERCVDTDRDPDNCGGCGVRCGGETPECHLGLCRTCEDAGMLECDGRCVQHQVDDANCGACGVECPGGTQCVDAQCTGGECGWDCGPSALCCDSVWGNRGCTDIRSDPENCGGCGVACFAGQACSAGTCGCEGWLDACGNRCVDTTSHPGNCGGCGIECPADAPLCVASQCRSCGDMGLEDCGGRCVDTAWDTWNCGGCGVRCDFDQWCDLGRCTGDWGGEDGGR